MRGSATLTTVESRNTIEDPSTAAISVQRLVEAEAIIGVQCRPVDFCDVAENSKDSGQGRVEVQMRLRILVWAAVLAASVAVPTPVLASGNGQRRVAPANARQLLVGAAQRHGLRPGFVLAVSYWE